MSRQGFVFGKIPVSYTHLNSSWLEHGGSPEKAAKSAFVSAIDKYLRDQGKYQKLSLIHI